MRVLVTAFDPFGGKDDNPSEIAVRALAQETWPAGLSVTTAILPTSFARAGAEIGRLIERHKPDLVIACGLAENTPDFRLERLARNRDCSAGIDNDGACRADVPIVPGGADHAATLPYDRIAAEMTRAGIPFRFSDDAGGFVCNHVFYRACEEAASRGRDILCGFIHVPPIAHSHGDFGLPLLTLTRGLAICVRAAGGVKWPDADA